MYKAKLCLGLSDQFKLPFDEQIRLFRKVGFEGFFVDWAEGLDISSLRKVADEEGMIFQSIHAPFEKMDAMWEPMETTETAIDELIRCLHDCKDNGVPIMVTHAFIGFEKHNPSDFGIENFGKVIEEAEKLGVKVAFENTEGEEYLAALMEHFKGSPVVGFCWDTGHELCYNRSKDMMSLYGDRLLGTHLNDNLGIRDYEGKITWIDDLHMLPFDGIADWQGIVRRLNKYGFNDILTFELNTLSKPDRHENDPYDRMSPVDYITAVYIRACKVAYLKLNCGA